MISAILTPSTGLTNHLTTTRGDSTEFVAQFTNDDGTAVDLTGAKLWLTAKRNLSDLDVDAVIRRTTDTNMGIVVSAPQSGQAVITLDPVQTQVLTRTETLFYDLQLKTFSGLVYTPVFSTIDVFLDVSRSSL